MSNSILTPTAVTREILRVLHQKLNFIGSIDRQYDDRFAKTGAKIGDSLKIRLPNQYTVRTGKTLQAQDTQETSETLTVATQKGVDMNFSTAELAMSLDDFSDRIIEPAVSVLVANIEYDAMSMYKDVYQSVWNSGSALTLANVLSGRKILQDSLAPLSGRMANLDGQQMVDLVTDSKSLFNDQKEISKQYREGYVGRALGFDFMENSMWPSHTRGAAASYVCNTSTGITSGSATITVSGGSGSSAVGDVFTIEGVNKVHPETKADTGIPQQFTVVTAGTTSQVVSPTPVTSGARQNVVINSAGASKTVTFAGTASGSDNTGLLFHKEAFTFATGDLEVPRGVHFAGREQMDGVSLRLVRQYDINNDNIPCRLDILYGYKTIRPQLAVRLHNN